MINPMFGSENVKKVHAEPHDPVIVSEVGEEGTSNPRPTKKEKRKFINVLREKWIAVQQHTHLAPLILAMIIVGVLLQIPTILYYTDPPSAEVTVLNNIDLMNCSVSSFIPACSYTEYIYMHIRTYMYAHRLSTCIYVV